MISMLGALICMLISKVQLKVENQFNRCICTRVILKWSRFLRRSSARFFRLKSGRDGDRGERKARREPARDQLGTFGRFHLYCEINFHFRLVQMPQAPRTRIYFQAVNNDAHGKSVNESCLSCKTIEMTLSSYLRFKSISAFLPPPHRIALRSWQCFTVLRHSPVGRRIVVSI